MSLWSQPFINRLIHHLVLCVSCLKTLYLICVVDSLTLNSWPTAPSLTPEGSLFNTYIFFIRHLQPSCTQGFERHSSTARHTGAILNSKITSKKHTRAKQKIGAKQTEQRTLVYSMRVETRKCSITLFNLSWEHECQASQIFRSSVHAANCH